MFEIHYEKDNVYKNVYNIINILLLFTCRLYIILNLFKKLHV